MIENDSKSPEYLVYRAVAGSLLTASGLAIVGLFGGESVFPGDLLGLTSHAKPILQFVMALFALIGFLISVQAESSLRDGVQSGLWPEDQLEALRRRIPAARYFNLASVLVGLAYLVFLAFALRFQTWRCDVPIWIATFPIQTIAGVSSILRNPQPVRPKEGLGLRNAQPIHSQEWGRTVR